MGLVWKGFLESLYNTSIESGEIPPVLEEDDPLFKDGPLFRFIDHLEEGEEGELINTDEDTSSTVAHMGWDADEEDLNTAGPSQPFWLNSF